MLQRRENTGTFIPAESKRCEVFLCLSPLLQTWPGLGAGAQLCPSVHGNVHWGDFRGGGAGTYPCFGTINGPRETLGKSFLLAGRACAVPAMQDGHCGRAGVMRRCSPVPSKTRNGKNGRKKKIKIKIKLYVVP